MKTPPHILTINGGSSSIKFALFEASRDTHSNPQRLFQGGIDRIGFPEAIFFVKGNHPEENFSHVVQATDSTAAINILISWIKDNKKCTAVTAIAHRIVHGGTRYYQPEQITTEMLQELHRLSAFDPDHLPMEVLLIEKLQQEFLKLPQIACFDTAFHQDLPRVAQLLPIPRCYEAKGVRRYGFHGLSCSFLLQELESLERLIERPLSKLADDDGEQEATAHRRGVYKRILDEASTGATQLSASAVKFGKRSQGKIIIAHLGNGASLTAVYHGKSIDTSMGFSPTSGIMMGTRSGDLDPELSSFLAQTEQMTTEQFQEMVNKKSGLLGISETSSDLRDLLAIEKKDVRAAEAIELFCYQIKKQIGSFAAALDGLDTLIFTGGIGEHAPSIRQRICDGLAFLGIELDEEKNQKNESVVSSEESHVTVRVIPTDEELMLAKSVIPFL
ncbi:MAG: hypothetical protein K2W97_04575 [Chthoniobacterales bacterium]|nr:hypothetical protein [Chthoniobacterales bacterium]